MSFKDTGFTYEPYLCNGCHDLMQKAMSFNDVAIVYVKGSAYRINIWCIMNTSNLIDKKGVSKKWISLSSGTPLKKLIIRKAEMWY